MQLGTKLSELISENVNYSFYVKTHDLNVYIKSLKYQRIDMISNFKMS